MPDGTYGITVRDAAGNYTIKKVSGLVAGAPDEVAQSYATAIARGQMDIKDIPKAYQQSVLSQLESMKIAQKPLYTVENAVMNGKVGTVAYNSDGTKTFTETESGNKYTVQKLDDGTVIAVNTSNPLDVKTVRGGISGGTIG